MLTKLCPCCSGLAYANCCQALHQGQSATSAEALMRSRFSAFALKLSDYLLTSWHPSTRPNELELDDNEQWLKLEILGSGLDWVEFVAIFREQPDSHKFYQLQERSRFCQTQGLWLYLDGRHQIKAYQPSRNELCPCGSGKKSKHCA